MTAYLYEKIAVLIVNQNGYFCYCGGFIMKVLRTLQRAVCILLVAIMTLSLTACGETLTNFAQSAFGDISARFEDNSLVLETLHESGVISKEAYEHIKANIDNAINAFETLDAYMDLGTVEKDDILRVLKGDEVTTNDGKIKTNINLLGAISGVVPVSKPYEDELFIKEDSSGNRIGNIYDTKYELDGEDGETQLKYLAFANYILADNWGISEESAYNTIGRWFFAAFDGSFGIYNDDIIAGIPATDVNGIFKHSTSVKCAPIKVVSDSDKEEVINGVNELLTQPIYVLRPDLTNNASVDATSLNILSSAKKAITDKNETELQKYFYQPESEEGEPLTLKIILEQAIQTNDNLSDLLAIKDELAEHVVTETTWNRDGESQNGKDIILTQFGKASTSFRLEEFNYRVCSLINEATGIFNNNKSAGTKYKLINGHVYMLEYPIEAIGNFEAQRITAKKFGSNEQEDNVVVNVGLVNSGMGINIMNGGIIKYHVNSNNTYSESGDYIDDSDFYLNSALYDDTNNSSFAIVGYTQLKVGSPKSALEIWKSGTWKDSTTEKLDLMGKVYTPYVPRIILTDYLEATFAPEWSPSDDGDVAIFGRKIRFSMKMTHVVDTGDAIKIKVGGSEITVNQKKIQYDRINYIATYCDRSGALNESHLQISEFCDMDLLVDKPLESKEVKAITPYGAEDTIVEARDKDEWESEQPDTQDLKYEIGSTTGFKIMPTRMFPGPELGNEDFTIDKSSSDSEHFKTTQRFWTVAVKKGIFDSGLYVTWIDSSTDGASLEWWNSYLETHHFKYKVDKDDITNYLLDSYLSQMQRAGIVIIDPNAIKDLQEMYGKEADMQRAATIKTTFAIIGWALISFSLILLLVWALDTNTDLGLNLLGKITFGHWIAVKYKSDIPEGDTEKVAYMSGDKVMIRCLIIIAVGILLITLNTLDIVGMLVDVFGNIASEIGKIIQGA